MSALSLPLIVSVVLRVGTLPVILIAGSCNTKDTIDNSLLYRTVDTHKLDYEYDMAKNITCAAAQIRHTHEVPELIDFAINQLCSA